MDEPIRLFEDADAPEGLGELFAQAQSDGLDPGQIARISARLDAVAPPPASAPLPSPSAAPGLSVMKWAFGLGIVAVGALGATMLAGGTGSSRPLEEPPPAQSAAPSVSGAGLLQLEASPAPESLIEVEDRPRRRRRRRRARAAEPQASTAVDPDPESSAGGESEGAGGARAEELSPDLIEGSLLLRARRALVSSPRRALVLLAEHQREFPNGRLVQEREVIAVDALVNLGQGGQARGRARRFNARFPGSAHHRRVQEILSRLD